MDQIKLSLDWLIQTGQNLFGPKMHLRMEFDSGVGPTCWYYFLKKPTQLTSQCKYNMILSHLDQLESLGLFGNSEKR